MIKFVLIFYICMPGAFDECSNGLKETRIENLPSKKVCESIAAEAVKKAGKTLGRNKITLTLCIPQETGEKGVNPR